MPPYGPGAVLIYTISVSNPQGYDIGGVRMTDTLPDHLVVNNVMLPAGAKSTTSGKTLSITDLMVPAGGTTQVLVSARVFTTSEFAAVGLVEDGLDGLVISNRATITGGCSSPVDTDDPEAPGLGPTEFVLAYAPRLATSSKAALDLNGAPLEPNDRLRFTIRVVNSGNRSADVLVQDAIPAGTRYVAGSAVVDGVSLPDVGGTSPFVAGYTLASVPYVGDNDRLLTFEARVDVSAANGSVVQNSAKLTPVTPNPVSVTVSSAPLTVTAAPKLDGSIKTVADLTTPGAYAPGDEVEYTIVVSNQGNQPAFALTVSDTVPAHLTVTQISSGGTQMGGVINWSLPALAAGASRAFRFQALLASPLDHGTLISNQASIDCLELPTFVTPPAQFVVKSAPRLVVIKVDEHASLPVRPGDPVTYRLRLRNDGNMTARHVVVTDAVDASLTNVAAPGATAAPAQVVWSEATDSRLAAIAPGDVNTVELVMTAQVVSPLANGTLVANQATVQVPGFTIVLSDDPDFAGGADPTTFTVVAQASLSVAKRVVDLTPATPFQPGDLVRYELVLTAAGDAPTRNLVVTDPVPSQLGAADASATGGSVSAGVATWTAAGNPALTQLDPGASLTLSFVATIVAGTADGAVVSNQAMAVSPDLAAPVASDGDAALAGAQPTVFGVVSRPLLRLGKSVVVGGTDGVFNPGDSVTYTLTLANAGTAAASNVVVTDTVPAQLTSIVPGSPRKRPRSLQWPLERRPSSRSRRSSPRRWTTAPW